MPRKFAVFMFTASLLGMVVTAHAQDYHRSMDYGPTMGTATAPGFPAKSRPVSYGEAIGMKAASGLANVTLGWIEIPKNIIHSSNQQNLVFGMTIGVLRATAHTLGRMMAGVTDLVTFPLPTQPIAYPLFVWQDFGNETQYGPIFKLQPLKP